MNWHFGGENCNLPWKILFNICHASVLIILYNKACAVAASYTFFEAQTFRFESRSNRIRCILVAEGEPFVKEQNKPRVEMKHEALLVHRCNEINTVNLRQGNVFFLKSVITHSPRYKK